MGIWSEIQRISGNVAATLKAITELGGDVPENATSDDMAEAVKSIPSNPPATHYIDWNTDSYTIPWGFHGIGGEVQLDPAFAYKHVITAEEAAAVNSPPGVTSIFGTYKMIVLNPADVGLRNNQVICALIGKTAGALQRVDGSGSEIITSWTSRYGAYLVEGTTYFVIPYNVTKGGL